MHDHSEGARRSRFGRTVTRPFRHTWADLRDPERSRAQRVGIGLAVALTWLALLPAAGVIFLLLHLPFAPTAAELQRETTAKPAIILASDGAEIGRFERAGRMWIPLDSVSQHFIDALLVTEDRRFFEHDGLDMRRGVAAGVRTLTGRTEGGSTLTQQLARNMYPDEIGRTLSMRRKAKEIITARRIEGSHSKEQILEAYVNTVPFLYNAFGAEMAARTYFDKPASDLDIAEAATLVGMLKGTSYYNPVRNPERAISRRNVVLGLMARAGHITAEELEELREEQLDLDFEPLDGPHSDHPHFTQYVRKWLSEWADRHGYDLFADGLVIHTTLDRELQREAERAATRRGDELQRVAEAEWSDGSGRTFGAFWARNPALEERTLKSSSFFREAVARGAGEEAMLDSIRANPELRDSLRREKSRVELGLVAIEPRTGHVKAWVGSRDFDEVPFDHVVQARRQPGSAFKPFVYAAALQRGFLPGDTFVDDVKEFDIGYGQRWRPTNAGGHYTGGPMTLTEALAYSKNTVTAQLMLDVGPANVVSVARNMGIRDSRLEALPALALGTSEVTLLEMVSAFATFADAGRYRKPVPVRRVENQAGRVLAEFSSSAEQAIPADVAQTVTHMLRGAIDRGTGRAIRGQFGIQADVAGKTGTSQRGADGWFILMHPELVVGSWVGFPEPSITWRTSRYGQGSRNALLVVGEFFRGAVQHLPDTRFETPARYREPGSIWERARRWWDGFFEDDDWPEDFDEDLYLTEIPYDDLSEWDPDTLDGFDATELDLDETDLDADPMDDEPDPEDDVPPVDDEPSAVQQLYDRLGEDLEDDLNDDNGSQ